MIGLILSFGFGLLATVTIGMMIGVPNKWQVLGWSVAIAMLIAGLALFAQILGRVAADQGGVDGPVVTPTTYGYPPASRYR